MPATHLRLAILLALGLGLSACGGGGGGGDDTTEPPAEEPGSGDSGPGGQGPLYNTEAMIPPMCYTRTGGNYNPCYTCHQDTVEGSGHANRMFDGYLQGDYNFSEVGQTNHWTNLFVDRSAEVAAIGDEEIVAYVAGDNYSGLADRLRAQDFRGYIPELSDLHLAGQAFDEFGFAKDGSGWVAFNYKPLPSTFWPTNGATDDVMLRMPEAFRNTVDGTYSRDVYLANLGILEASIKDRAEVTVPAVDEQVVGTDLDGDGQLGTATRIVRPSHYVGAAAGTEVVTYLYPKGMEFLHSVRYIGVDDAGDIYVPPRMKELRYMRKVEFHDKTMVAVFYDDEAQEKYEGNPPYYRDAGDNGVENMFGWQLKGFIEDASGELRAQSYEEDLFCMGCHSTVGATIDQTFAFGRKVDGAEGWGYIDLRGMPDVPALGETEGEILQYLRRVGGGDEFRQNTEMMERWFKADGSVDEAKVNAAADVYELITPSRERALTLNKAYRVIVSEQSFLYGRDPTVSPATNVYTFVDVETAPLLPKEKQYQRDIRLDW